MKKIFLAAAMILVVSAAQAKLTSQIDSVSYAVGVSVGNDLRTTIESTFENKHNMDLVIKGLVEGLKGEKTEFTKEEANGIIESYMMALFAEKEKVAKEANQKFLAENAKRKGVKTTASGLQYEVIKKGTGKVNPTETSTVKVDYEGTLIDGTVFDSSIQRGEPIEFALNQVIKGWTEGVQLMTEGATFKFYIPSELGYGAQQAGSIPPNSVLIFEVRLLEIKK
jgi:FKBP-type peptidyl-prolyl cis-trans isomerase